MSFRSSLFVPVAVALGLSGAARAQSLQELYEAAHAYDATYLSAKAQADTGCSIEPRGVEGERVPRRDVGEY